MINTKPLIKFSLWIFTLLLVCMVGASGVFALEYTDIGYVHTLSGVNGQVTIDVTYETESGAPLTINRNQVIYTQLKVMNVFISNYSFEANRQYQIEMEFPYQQLQYANTYQVFGANNELCSLNYSNSIFNSQWPRWNWSCPHSTNEVYLKVYNSNNTAITSYGDWSWNYIYLRYTNTSIDSDITDTDSIINNANQNTDRIINNNNQNTQDIINNNDENTNKIIEENNKNFNDCHNSVNLFQSSFRQGNVNGTNTATQIFDDINYQIISGQDYTFSTNLDTSIYKYQIFLNDNTFPKSPIDYEEYTSGWKTSSSFTFNLNRIGYLGLAISRIDGNNISPSDISNFYFQLQLGTSATSYEQYGKEICTNKLDEQKNAINNVDNTLKDDSVDDNGVADAFESFNDYLDDNSTITQLITLPITLYTAILNNLNGTCSPFNLGELYGESLILPCINISQYLGNSLWTMIDIIISGFAVYAISKKMIKVFNNFSSLREGDVIDD